MDVAKRYQDQLARIKTNVRESQDYFRDNIHRFNEYKNFVFNSSLSSRDIALLANLGKPQLEFNVLEAYISRLIGEFSKQEPDVIVHAENESNADPLTIKVVEQHLRHELSDAENDHMKYLVYKDLLGGGFSAIKVYTEYANSMSFDQVIHIDRVYDPTLCGFDPTARDTHKGDGKFCFELFPMQKDKFKNLYPDIDISTINFVRNFEGFNWAYKNGVKDVLVVCDYYEKKVKKIKIVKLRDGRVMTMKDYDEMVSNWMEFLPPPVILGKPRWTDIEIICRYRLIDNRVIEYVETDFSFLPIIFVDGNSEYININNEMKQMTRPYVYHAKGAQRLKNFAGIELANQIENIVQHKFMVAKEALPKEQDFLAAYKDIQHASVLVYNSLFEQDPNIAIPNPIREVVNPQMPQEVIAAFSGADSLIQNILGSYDAALGLNKNQLSGVAIVEAASQSNATAMPYVVGFLQGLQRAAQVYVDLMPKYYQTPRTIPVMDNDGQKSYIRINEENGFKFDYDSNVLNVIVKAGASFQVQKSRTINMVKEMMGMSPLFSQFIADKGLTFVLDNMEGKGIEQLKQMVEGWLQEMQQQKQIAMQSQMQQMQNNPAMMKAQVDQAKVMLDAQKNQQQFAVDMAKLRADEQKILADLQQTKQNNEVQLVKAETEQFAKKVDLALKSKDLHHRHLKDTIEVHHKLNRKDSHHE